MPIFSYKARNQEGVIQTGRFEATTEDEALVSLQHRGLLVITLGKGNILPAKKQPEFDLRRAGSRRMHRKVTTEDQVLLCQQLATMVEAGVPLLKSLEVVSAQVESQLLLMALDRVRKDVEAGQTFTNALAKHPGIFSSLWINLVETGEASGHLAETLQQLATHFEKANRLKNEVQTALTYPLFLVAASVGVLTIFMYWIVPRFQVMFEGMGMELPLITLLVMKASVASRKYGVIVFMALFAGGYLLKRYLNTEPGKWMKDRLVLKLPLFGVLVNFAQLAEFTQGLATLLNSGVPLLSGLDILATSAGNKVYGRAIEGIRDAVKEGKPMAEPMSRSALFPPMAVQMVLVGEEVGELGKMIKRVAIYYEERAETFVARLTKLFEPIAIVFMGGLVLIIVLSIFMPIFKMASGANIK